MIVNKLFWQKYRPKTIEGLILLPRIKEQLFNDNDELIINNNMIFTGGPGLGKSSLSELIIPKSSFIVNASYDSSVEDLRGNITDYCKQVGTGIFDDDYDPNVSSYKFIYLNEFDGISSKYQEAFRAFIEEYASRVRFIATCNNIGKITPELLSRFTIINFNPENAEEREWLMNEYINRCQYVVEKNNIEINEKDLKDIITLNFPDLRSMLNQLQQLTGKKKKDAIVTTTNIDFFNLIFEKIEPNKTYDWVMSNYGDKVEPLLVLCGRYLTEYICQYKQDKISTLPKILPVVASYTNMLPNAIDPLVLATACIFEIQTIIHK